MDSEEVLMMIHEHPMMPLKASTHTIMECSGCERYEINTDGYECGTCGVYFHKSCGESSESIRHPSHRHTLQLQRKDQQMMPGYDQCCNLCGKDIENLFYRCDLCYFKIDLYCAKYPPPEVIDISEVHHHKLILLKDWVEFDCAACVDTNCGGFRYKCHECDLAFHVDCVWHPSELELNHSHHPLHPLKLQNQHRTYSDGKCSLCEGHMDGISYHCAPCNFTVDLRCVFDPPPKSLLELEAHDHQLTLLPRLDYFICNACGLKGDRSPYVCFECGFMIHQSCLHLPCVININRHDHRVIRSSILGFMNLVCGVCHKKVDWTRGGFSCQKCRGYVVHSKCATRRDVWNGQELKGVPEETEDIEPYVVIDDNTIRHFSHKEHHLKLHLNDVLCDNNMRCRACTHPICLQSFYGCKDCDFILHQNCAGFFRKKRHFLHNDRLTLVTDDNEGYFHCTACERMCNGFKYQDEKYQDENVKLDVRCASISEPFFHPSHPNHLLYHTLEDKRELCNGCEKTCRARVNCIEDDCEYSLCFNCATIPSVVKHRVDDHPLSLCYGEKASGKYWCDICEKETDPKKWFYTCKDHQASMHTMCVLGDLSNLMPKRTINIHHLYYGLIYYEVMLNSSVSRPICSECKLHCMFPLFLKGKIGTSHDYFCSHICFFRS